MSRLLFIPLVFLITVTVFADAAPDPGYTNVVADMVLVSDDDLSAFRFFLETPVDVEEIKVKTGSPTVVAAIGRGGARRYAKLIAVPLNDMSAISGDLSGGLLDHLVRERRFPNAKELFAHNFQATIPVIEKPIWKPPVYRLRLEAGGIVAEKSAAGAYGGMIMWLIPAAAVGVLIALGIAIIGIWLFRRSRSGA